MRSGVCLLFALVLLAPAMPARGADDPRLQFGDDTLVVGGQDEMKTRNPLPGIASDPWTRDVLLRVYDSPVKIDPETERALPHITKGVDADGDGIFETAEWGVFWKNPFDWQGNPCTVTNGCLLDVTVFYDFNGVFFHDGAQADVWDLLFSYHVAALSPRANTDLRPLMDTPFVSNRQLFLYPVNVNGSDWAETVPVGADANLRASVRFAFAEPFAVYPEGSLNILLFPQHVWEKTGQRGDAPAPVTATDIHGDFGCLIYPPTPSGNYTDTAKAGRGIPVGAADLPAGCTREWDYANGAEKWAATDADVIGTGPFRFQTWQQGSIAQVGRNDAYFVGVNPGNLSQVFDARLLAYLKLPEIDGILFKIYRSTTLGVLALKRAEIDFYHWNIPAEFVPDLLNEPNIAVEANPELGFFYMAYNLRRSPFGYDGFGDDVGYDYRQAVSHLVDKKSIVQNLLQNFGVIGHGVISPANTFWYNDNIVKPAYDLTQAASILNAAYGPDPPGTCDKNNPSGCRSLPTIGNGFFEILTPQADYDPVRAAAGQMIADAMRSVGINVESKPLAFGEIVARLDARNFDQYILDWRIDGTDPDYLFRFFHSSNSPAGQNYPGFENTTFDAVIEASRRELDRTARQALIFEAQEILADARSYEVLYYRTNIEGYRQDRWVNWTVAAGTIWNYWSLLGIRPPGTPALRPVITLPSAVASGGSANVTVTVFDALRARVAGATVRLELTWPTAGDLTNGTYTGLSVEGVTDSLGRFTAGFLAATLAPGGSWVTQVLTAYAWHPSYPEAGRRHAGIVVVPPGNEFLAVTVDLYQGDVAVSGGSLPARITVTNTTGAEMPDSDVTVVSSNPALTPNPGSGKARDLATVTLDAEVVTQDTSVDIVVDATQAGYSGVPKTVEVTIVVATAPNQPPIPLPRVWPAAWAGVGQPLLFDGANSTDPDGVIAAYDWEFGDGFQGTGSSVTHAYGAPGGYTVTLWVTDDDGATRGASVLVNVTDIPPTAVISVSPGPSGDLGTVFAFDGTASFDDGAVTAFLWEFGDGAADQSAVTAHSYASRGTYVVRLTVWDDDGARDSAQLSVDVGNRAPGVIAEGPVFSLRNATVHLTATAGDEDGDQVSYAWTQTAGPPVLLSGADTRFASFVPTAVGPHAFSVAVADGRGGTAVGNVTVDVLNREPTAVAGADFGVPTNTTVLLDGTGSSDADLDPLSLSWAQTAGPPVTLTGTGGVVSFPGADPGTYVFELTATDPFGGSDADSVTVYVNTGPPTARFTVRPGHEGTLDTVFTFDASASSDPDGAPTFYDWDFGDGGWALSESVVTHTYPMKGEYSVTLRVFDGEGNMAQAWVSVRIVNTPPLALVDPEHTGTAGSTISLIGTGADREGDALTFSWTQLAGPPMAGFPADGEIVSFTPAEPGTYRFALLVTDGEAWAMNATTVRVDPAEAWPMIQAATPDVTQVALLPGARREFSVVAVDPDGDSLTYTWRLNGAPVSGLPTYEFRQPSGVYTVSVTVSDGTIEVAREWTVEVEPAASSRLAGEAEAFSVVMLAVAAAVAALAMAWRRERRQ